MKNAMRARPVGFAQNERRFVARMKRSEIRDPPTDSTLVQNSMINTIAKIDAPENNTAAPGIIARKSVISQALASHASDHIATRANNFTPCGSAPAGGSIRGNEMTSANSTQLKITSG